MIEDARDVMDTTRNTGINYIRLMKWRPSYEPYGGESEVMWVTVELHWIGIEEVIRQEKERE